jgi:Ca2+-binding EF-hand superfamily protein
MNNNVPGGFELGGKIQAKMDAAFKEADKDGDGRLSKKEFKESVFSKFEGQGTYQEETRDLAEKYLEREFRAADENENRNLNIDEYSTIGIVQQGALKDLFEEQGPRPTVSPAEENTEHTDY